MAIGSSNLTKVGTKTGEVNKPQSESPSSDSSKPNSSFRTGETNQGDNDSEATSFCSSVYGSTSSATSSSDRLYSSRMKERNRQNKTVDNLNSKKPTDALQKPVQKLTRSGSLRPLRISRKQIISSLESKALTVEDSHSKKATFSSILKDSKFPHEEVVSEAKVCRYEHCSLRSHHHEPPVKRFSYLKRRSSSDQKGVNPQTQAIGKRSVKKNEVKVTKNVSNECVKKTDDDSSKQFYAKTRKDEEKVNDDENKRNQAVDDDRKGKSEGWNRVKKVVLMRRFITELEKTKKKIGPDKRGHVELVPEPEPEPEAEIVLLRSRTTGEKRNSNEWMVDYALQQVVAELAPTQRRKVALLVKSFEMVTPKHHEK